MIRVFICDDHKLVVEGLQLILNEEKGLMINGFCYDGETLLETINKNTFESDIILLDINLPGINGIEVCKQIVALNRGIKIIALSMLKELSLVKLMMKSGASGYLLKNAGRDEIVTALKTVHDGKKYIDDELKYLLIEETDSVKPKRSTELIPTLSRREKEVLSFILEEYTTSEIAEKLFISIGTVETHRRNILSKFGARNTAGIVRMAIEYNVLGK